MLAEYESERVHDNIPSMVQNKHTTYENTILHEHSAILNALKDTEAKEAVLESQGRLFIGICLRETADEFIEKNYKRIYDEEYAKAQGSTDDDKVSIATSRAWSKLINKATAKVISRYKIDGTVSRLAVIDDELPEGKHIKEFVEPPEVTFEDDEDFRKGTKKIAAQFKEIFGAFRYAQWVAKQITNKRKNIDRKIFIVGDSGDGKSVTGLSLAKAIAKWVSFYVYGDFTHASEFWKFDKDHIAVISTDDLLHVQSVELPKYSVKIIDDCGAAKGFTNRRSMSEENLDVVSIIGTNRVRNGVTIVCIQTEYFTDVRMRLLANDKIDLTNYTPGGREGTNAGLLRIGKLYKMRRDKKKKNKVIECRFMTYTADHKWSAIEGICCFMPEDKLVEEYNELRILKEKENTEAINKKYRDAKQEEDIKDSRPKCPYCNSADIRYREKTKDWKCKSRGHIFATPG